MIVGHGPSAPEKLGCHEPNPCGPLLQHHDAHGLVHPQHVLLWVLPPRAHRAGGGSRRKVRFERLAVRNRGLLAGLRGHHCPSGRATSQATSPDHSPRAGFREEGQGWLEDPLNDFKGRIDSNSFNMFFVLHAVAEAKSRFALDFTPLLAQLSFDLDGRVNALLKHRPSLCKCTR